MAKDITQMNIDSWLTGKFDQNTKKEILRMQEEDPAALSDAFYRTLEFGTGGMRGILGVGTNRMNKYTVGFATQGLANYLIKCFKKDIKVAISFDSRNGSTEFARSRPTYCPPTAYKSICSTLCVPHRSSPSRCGTCSATPAS